MHAVLAALEAVARTRAAGPAQPPAEPSRPEAPLPVERGRHTGRLLGVLLVTRGMIMQSDLDAALEWQAVCGRRLGEILVEKGLVTEHDLMDMLAEQQRLPTFRLGRTPVDDEVVAMLDRRVVWRLQAVPFRRSGAGFDVVVADPTDEAMLTELWSMLGAPLRVYVAPWPDVASLINAHGRDASTDRPPARQSYGKSEGRQFR